MKTEIKNDSVIAYPEGRIDSNTAKAFLDEFKAVSNENEGKKLVINMENIEYVSSAGLRIFLSLQKTVNGLQLIELQPAVYEVFHMTDFTDIIDVKKALRRISIDGCEVIGRGFYGTVYRIDEDTIVKAYNTPDCIPMIENEQLRAKQALKAGIPTAIAYDLVRIGDSYGSVFELLKAKTLNDMIKDNPECADEVIDKYADFIRLVHSTEMEPGLLPSAGEKFSGFLDVVKEYLDDDICGKLREYLGEFGEDNHVVHGDIMMKNVMMVDGEPMLIDMDTLMVGHPIFDFAGLYATYVLFEMEEPGNTMSFLGLSAEMCKDIWTKTFNKYFEGVSEEEKEAILDKIRIASNLRFLYIVVSSDLKNSEIGEARIRNAGQRFRELIPKVDSLYFDVNRDI